MIISDNNLDADEDDDTKLSNKEMPVTNQDKVGASKGFSQLLKSLALAQSPKSKSKGEALGQSILLNLVYTHTHTHPPTHKLLGHFPGI